MPAAGSAANRAWIPPGRKLPPAVKLPLCQWVSQHDDGENRDRDLPPRDDVVDPGEDAHGQEVDRDEDRHQHDGQHEADPGDVARRGVVDAGPEVGGVLHEREALDRRDRHGLDVGEEPEPDAGHAAEREVREPGRSAGDRVHRAELGVSQGQDDNDDADDDPGHDGGAAHRLRGVQGAEQPARADDRCLGRPGGADQSQLSLKADISRLGYGDPCGFCCHGRSLFPIEPWRASHPQRAVLAPRPDERLVCFPYAQMR